MKLRVISSLLAGLLLSVGCGNKVQFRQFEANQSLSQSPIVIPPVVPTQPQNPSPPPSFTLKAGTCSEGGENLLSCMSCQSTRPIPAPPQFSRKGQALWDIMTAACSIPNRSDPRGYTPPTREQILQRIIQCSPQAYPDSNWMGTQERTIQQLLTNPVAQRRAFGGLYYNSASTDFETYFGLDIAEARYTFCFGQASFGSGGVYPKEYYDAWYDNRPYELPLNYVRAQNYRSQLRSCLSESLRNPNRPQQPGTPGITCDYQTLEGEISEALINQIGKWIQAGHTVSFEGLNQCGLLDSAENLLDSKGLIKLAIKTCR
jgi:hypothetical protein